MKRIIPVCFLLSFLTLVGCGQTGALYLPAAQQTDQSSISKD